MSIRRTIQLSTTSRAFVSCSSGTLRLARVEQQEKQRLDYLALEYARSVQKQAEPVHRARSELPHRSVNSRYVFDA